MVSFSKITLSKAPALFDIRLDNDFIVYRGSEHESSCQLLKGTVVLCLVQPLKVEDIVLRLTGDLRLNWTDQRVNSAGVTNHRVDRHTEIYSHKFESLTDLPTKSNNDKGPNRSVTLGVGNYEYPFEFMLPGNLTESVEGLREGNITYRLKATICRGPLSHNLHAYKRLRIIRTLDPAALEVLHAMSVENIWPNKVEYSITVPQKAVVFGTCIPLETRFTPLLKGLDIGDVTVKLVESQEILHQTSSGHNLREYRKERDVDSWTIPINRDEHWQDMIEDTGQEGWVMKANLDLPRKLGRCIQDVNAHGIKIRHKLKIVVALKNPDGHISELRATLPVSIFISPNMPLDEEGNLVHQLPQGAGATQAAAMNAIAPPGYGEHILDQLYDELDPTGLQTPVLRSGVSTPTFGHSRAGSAENLQALGHHGVTPAALSSRLQSVSLERSRRNHSYNSLNELSSMGRNSGMASPRNQIDVVHFSPPPTAPLSRQHSDDSLSGANTPEHIDFPEQPPSYQKTPGPTVWQHSILPDYFTATSAPNSRANSPPGSPQPLSVELPANTRSASLEAIEEAPQEASSPLDEHHPPSREHNPPSREHTPTASQRSSPRPRRRSSLSLPFSGISLNMDDEARRLHLLRLR
ncbi:Arrestin (or S-antigen), N-terminal domain containing protein [Naviculisporaceae sp. PSN 640]